MKLPGFVLTALLIAHSPLQVEPGEYRNPLLTGFYPDPSICRAGAHDSKCAVEYLDFGAWALFAADPEATMLTPDFVGATIGPWMRKKPSGREINHDDIRLKV